MDFQGRLIVQNWPSLLTGLGETVAITLAALLIGILFGALLCTVRLSRPWAGRQAASGVIAFFRTTPEMVLLFWAYFCVPEITGANVPALAAGIVTLGLVTGAYLAEIFRAGIQALPHGQNEAARALGLRSFARWRCVLLPQALRGMTPPLMNYFTELVKNTTLLSAIGVSELSLRAYLLGGQSFRYLEFLTAIAIGYFVLIFPASLLSRRLEARQARA